MCRLRNIAKRDYQESVTTGKTHRRTDRCRTKWSLCAAMLRRRHNKWGKRKIIYQYYLQRQRNPLMHKNMLSLQSLSLSDFFLNLRVNSIEEVMSNAWSIGSLFRLLFFNTNLFNRYNSSTSQFFRFCCLFLIFFILWLHENMLIEIILQKYFIKRKY